jgi:uncharacterized protein (DUF433 family)
LPRGNACTAVYFILATLDGSVEARAILIVEPVGVVHDLHLDLRAVGKVDQFVDYNPSLGDVRSKRRGHTPMIAGAASRTPATCPGMNEVITFSLDVRMRESGRPFRATVESFDGARAFTRARPTMRPHRERVTLVGMFGDWIASDPTILGGKPCVKGTRISVELILELLSSGASQDAIQLAYPHVPAAGIAAAIEYAARALKNEVMWDVKLPRDAA